MNQLTVSPEKLRDMKQFLDRGLEEMSKVLPEFMKPETLVRYAINAAQNNPTLLLCTPQSVGLSLMNAAALGLDPNGRDGHLVPYNQWNKDKQCKEWVCQFIPDYKGYIKLMHQNQNLQSVSAGAVREHDEFDYEFGSNAFLRHKPHLTEDRGDLIAAWAMYKLKDGSSDFIVLTQSDVKQHEAASPSSSHASSPWKKWPDPMWAKTAVRILQKFAPLGPAIEAVSQYEEQVDLGTLPADRIHNATDDDPRITFDFEGETIDVPDEPQTKSDELAEKVKSKGGSKKQQDTKPTYYNETQLNEKLKLAEKSGDVNMLQDFQVMTSNSINAGVIDEAAYNALNERCDIALEELRAADTA